MNRIVRHPLTYVNFFDQLQDRLELCQYSQQTIKAYLGQICSFLKHARPLDLKELTREDILDYIGGLVELGYSRSSVDQAVNAMDILWMEITGESLELQGLQRPRKSRPAGVVLSLNEVKRIAVCAENLKHRLMIEMAYTAGLRVSEVVEVRVGHLNLEKLHLFVPALNSRQNGRTTVFSASLRDALARQIGNKQKEDYLFPSRRGGRMTTRAVAKFFKAALEVSGVDKPASPQTLRHSFVAFMREQGTDASTLQSMLGQKTLSTHHGTTSVTLPQGPGRESMVSPASL